MNPSISQINKTAGKSALPFEFGGGARGLEGKNNFGAELDRATTSRSFRDANRVAERKPASSRAAKQSPLRRHDKPESQERLPRDTKPGVHGSRTSHAPHKPSDASEPLHGCVEERPTSADESESQNELSGALAVEAAMKPVVEPVTTGGDGEIVPEETPVPSSGGLCMAETLSSAVESTGKTSQANAGLETKEGAMTLPAGFESVQPVDFETETVSAAPQVTLAAADGKTSSPQSAKDVSIAESDTSSEGIVTSAAQLQTLGNTAAKAPASPASEGESDEARLSPDAPTDSAATLISDEPRKPARRASDAAPERPRGISAAQMAAAMKNTANKDEFAGSGGQNLPGGNNSAGRAASSAAGKVPVTEMLFAPGNVATAKSFEARPDGIPVAELARFDATRAERLGDLISREVRMFKRTADDQVDVVLTPDSKTQISLRLQWRDGEVEVQARCELGDHRSLSLQWGQLQSSLAQQGVRLAPLTEREHTGFTEFFAAPNFSQSQRDPQGGHQRPEPKLPATELPAIPVARPVKTSPVGGRPAPTTDRFETWA